MLVFVPLNYIDDNPYQRRAEYGDIEELAERIHAAKSSYPETLGLMQVPRGRVVVVDTDTIVGSDSVKRFVGKDGRWNEDPKTFRIQLAFGHRRKRAFEYLNRFGEKYDGDYYYMPIHIDPLTDKQMLDAVWAENYERKDISAVEQAELIQLKLQQLGPDATHAAIGSEWGLSRPVISNRLRLLELPAEVQQANRAGKLSERQALALAPIVKIDEFTNGRVQWSKKSVERITSWETPASPQAYIQHILEHEDVTSDGVRDYANKLLKHAGADLPAAIATFKCDHGRVRQAQCKGCPARMNQSCLDSSCLDIKKEAFRTVELAAVSTETGYPISDREEDFTPFANDGKLRHELAALFEAGIEANYVIRWQGYGAGYYPWSTNKWYVYQDEYGSDRPSIALGHRGSLTPYLEQLKAVQLEADSGEAENDPKIAIEDIPDRTAQLVWIDEAKRLEKATKKAARGLLVDALYPHANDTIQALICNPEEEWIDDGEELTGQFVEFLWRHGNGVRLGGTPYQAVQGVVALLRRAGLKAPEISQRDQAVLALAFWSEYREYSWSRKRMRPYLAETIARLDSAGQLDGELRQLRYELGRAQTDVALPEPPAGMVPWVGMDSAWTCPACNGRLPWGTIEKGARAATCSCGLEAWEDGEDNYCIRQPAHSAVSPANNNYAVAWLRAYVDDTGRTWQDLEPNQTHHANSPCFQAFTRAFPDEAEPKWQLKQARAILERETAVVEEVSA